MIEGIGCLLTLWGNKARSRFTGYTRVSNEVASPPPPPLIKKPASVEVAALYYISYMFYDKWEHAGSTRLFDETSGKISYSEKTVKRAYESYLQWFKKIQLIGVDEARKQKLDPLAGSGIGWS